MPQTHQRFGEAQLFGYVFHRDLASLLRLAVLACARTHLHELDQSQVASLDLRFVDLLL